MRDLLACLRNTKERNCTLIVVGVKQVSSLWIPDSNKKIIMDIWAILHLHKNGNIWTNIISYALYKIMEKETIPFFFYENNIFSITKIIV